MFNEAVRLQGAGRLAEAEAMYRRVAADAPLNAGVLYNLGVVQYLQGKPGDAVTTLRRATALKPDFPEALCNLGLILIDLRRTDEAIAALRRALALRPDYPVAWCGLGKALREAEQFDDVAAAARRAIALTPAYAEAHGILGLALKDLGRFDDALAAQRQAIALNPGFAEAWNNLGVVLKAMGRFGEAADAYGRAIAFKPGFAEAHSNLGSALLAQGRLDQAAAALGQAIALRPDFPEALSNLGRAVLAMGLAPQAMDCYRAALALEAPKNSAPIHRNMMACAVYADDMDAGQVREIHQAFAHQFGGRDGILGAPPARSRDDASRPIRVGYLSSDLYEHPVARNMLPVFRDHDRTGFSIHVYYAGTVNDGVTAQIRPLADGWNDVAGLSDLAIARRIRADAIDILVCLAGRFDENRLPVCGFRAAPVQISLHDVATSGLAEMDYIIGDRWLLPPGGSEYFTERRLRLPQFYIADLPPHLPPPKAPRTGAPVFGCFNNPSKISPTALALWGRILAARPEARLALKYRHAYASPDLCRRIRAQLTAAGAGAEQVTFIADSADAQAFLALYNDVDIALDTFPFCGSTTSFQALAMGVPVVTWPQDRMVSRWTAAMLHPLGLTELIAGSADDYVAKAVEVAGAVELWRRRRTSIRDAVAASRLCRSPRWSRHLERLYRAVLRRIPN